MFSFARSVPAAAPRTAEAALPTRPPASGEKADLKEQVRAWQKELRGQMHQVERQIREMETERKTYIAEAKAVVKKDPVIAKMLVKNVILAGKLIERMRVTNAQINSVSMQLQEQASMYRVAGAMGASAEIMHAMAKLINAPQVMDTMRTLSSEMSKAGIISDMMAEALAAAEPEGLDEAADEELERVMSEILAGVSAPSAPMGAGVVSQRAAAASEPASRGAAVAVGDEDSDAADRLSRI